MVVQQRLKVVGQRYPNVDASAKVTGKSIYGADVHIAGALHGKILRSSQAHAYIKNIDCSKALQLPGVRAVVTGGDFPSVAKNATVSIGEFEMGVHDLSQLLIARGKVLFHGQPVAAVAATARHIAEEAVALIDVEYEPLPVVLDPVKAMAPDAPLLHEDLYTRGLGGVSKQPSNVALHAQWDRGDVAAAFEDSDVVVERTFVTQTIDPGYIEPEAETAYVHPDGRVEVWTCTRGTFFHRNQISILLGIPTKLIRVYPTTMGGAFGGKMHALVSPLCVKLAQATGHPVRIVLDREEVLRSQPPAPRAVITAKIGAKKDGRITAIQGKLIYDAGAFPGASVMAGMTAGAACYKTPNLHLEGYDVVTNKPRVGSVRAPGARDGSFAFESVIDEVADAIGMDPVEFRLKNCVEEGDPQPNGLPYGRIGLKQLLERALTHPAWTTPTSGRNTGRGVAVGYWGGGVNTSSCHLTVTGDGVIHLTVGSVEMSTARTGFVQICADALQIPPEDIHVTEGDTETSGYTDITGGSRMTRSMGAAIILGAQELLEQMKGVASQRFNAAAKDVEYADGQFFLRDTPDKRLTFKEVALQSTRSGGALMARGSNPRLKPAPAFGLHIADVAVDPETGKATVTRYTAFQDVGHAVNPSLIEGQLQGGAVQGIGWALTEERLYDERGVLRNPSLLDYRMPTALDLPMIDTEIVEVPAADGPFGTRGVGECPVVPVAGALGNAIYRATGARLTELPMNPERVFWSLRKREDSSH